MRQASATTVAVILVAFLLAGGCDAPGYKKLHDRYAKLWEEHQSLKKEHEQLRAETIAMLEETVKERKLDGLHSWTGGEIVVGEGYVEKIRCVRDHKEMSVQVRFDVAAGRGKKPNFEIYFHDTTGRVIGRCGKKRIWKKISSDYTGETLEAQLSTAVNPAFFSVTIR